MENLDKIQSCPLIDCLFKRKKVDDPVKFILLTVAEPNNCYHCSWFLDELTLIGLGKVK